MATHVTIAHCSHSCDYEVVGLHVYANLATVLHWRREPTQAFEVILLPHYNPEAGKDVGEVEYAYQKEDEPLEARVHLKCAVKLFL